MAPASQPTVLHVSPHPDDELIGAGATLMALGDCGHRVINYAVGLGRPGDRERRRAELVEACRRAAFDLRIAEPPLAISRDNDLEAAEAALTERLRDQLAEVGPALVVSPSPHDGHHGHEVVGRAVRAALRELESPPPWWLWGLWGDLPLPTLLFPFGDSRLRRVVHALEAYAVELARNDYRRLVRGRAMANAVLGPERVFGHGAAGRSEGYAELLTEVVRRGGAWHLGLPRELDPSQRPGVAATVAVDDWIDDGVSRPGPGRSRRRR